MLAELKPALHLMDIICHSAQVFSTRELLSNALNAFFKSFRTEGDKLGDTLGGDRLHQNVMFPGRFEGTRRTLPVQPRPRARAPRSLQKGTFNQLVALGF